MNFSAGETSVRVNVAGAPELLGQVRARLAAGAGFAVATLNLDHAVKLRRDRGFAVAYARHDMVVADGRPIVWLARLGGRRIGLVPGSDMIVPLCEVARDLGVPVALVGGTDAVLRRAATALERGVPGLEISCRIAPSQGFDPDGAEAREVLAELKNSGARLCFLALGAPKQELFAANAREIAPDMGFVSIGAGLDFLSGAQKRAPGWVRGLALEWLWRVLVEPRRMAPRYLACFGALPRLAVAALRSR